MLQIPLGSRDNNTAGVQSSVSSYILDNLARFVKAGAIRDRVKNKEDVCIGHNALKLLFGVLKKIPPSSCFMKQFYDAFERLLLVTQV